MSDKYIKPLSNTETAAFCSQMAMILKSGISSVEGISILLEDVDDPDEKNLLTVLNDTLIQTGDFSQSLKSTGAFPDYMVHMVTLGEQAGRLDEVMASLSDYYDKEAALNQTIRSAVTYPLIMILMMLLVILVLITKIMPIFNQVFKQLGSEMSGLSLAILQAGEFLNSHAIVCAIVCAVLIILFFYLFRTERGHRTLRTWARHLPGMRTLSERISSSRFANGITRLTDRYAGRSDAQDCRSVRGRNQHQTFWRYRSYRAYVGNHPVADRRSDPALCNASTDQYYGRIIKSETDNLIFLKERMRILCLIVLRQNRKLHTLEI